MFNTSKKFGDNWFTEKRSVNAQNITSMGVFTLRLFVGRRLSVSIDSRTTAELILMVNGSKSLLLHRLVPSVEFLLKKTTFETTKQHFIEHIASHILIHSPPQAVRMAERVNA